ncbi:MAG: diguanylate cyclase [Pseudomonadota bacterium]
MLSTIQPAARRGIVGVDRLIGLALLLLGSTTMLGWLLHVPAMVELKRGLVPMVFNTGLCFFLSGAALVLGTYRRCRRIAVGIGAALMLLGAATLSEHLFDARYGIDLAFLHSWYDYGNTRPGRMAPNTAAGFVLFGAAAALLHNVRRRRQAIGVVVLTFLVLALGLSGLAGYLLAPELMFNWARSARMALHTATGMCLCAVGLWAAWSKSAWYVGEKYFREDGKIRLLSGALSILSTLTIGLTGLALLQGNLQSALENRLEAIVISRVPWFTVMTAEVAERARALARIAEAEQSGRRLLAQPQDATARALLAADAAALLRAGIRGVAVLDMNGRALHAAGRFTARPHMAAPLGSTGTELVWDGELLLRVRVPLRDGMPGLEKDVGSIALDTSLAAVRKPLFNIANLGGSAELDVCVDGAVRPICFPNKQNMAPFAILLSDNGSVPRPMRLALAGQRGVLYAVDHKGHNVLAAYGPLAPGLGFVVKQDTVEAYAGIRQSLAIGAPIIIGVSLLGAILLFSQLSPLVSKMRASELRASEAAAEMETIMAAAGDGIVTIDQEGLIESINLTACRIFGYRRHDVIGHNITTLIPVVAPEEQRSDPAWLAQGGMAHLLGAPNLDIEGRRQDGDLFALELSINPVPVQGRKLFIAIMRDITVRKEMEERLSRLAQFDTLTGLPNRALFMDRLSNALARMRRARGTLTLMFLDLDGFKAINDTFGHQGGDLLLTQVAARLQAAVRKSDTVARLAGDEFTIILESMADPERDGVAVAQKLLASLQQPFLIDAREAQVTASIGLIVHRVEQGDISVAEILRRADEQMYAVKRAGKNAIGSNLTGAATSS